MQVGENAEEFVEVSGNWITGAVKEDKAADSHL
jgi:hypothetical protein